MGSAVVVVTSMLAFKQVLDNEILIIDYIRAINRIRSYFVENAPYIKPFLLMPTSSDYPKYGWRSSLRYIPILLSSLSFGIATTIIVSSVRCVVLPNIVNISLSIVAFILIYISHITYAKFYFKKADKKARDITTVLYEANRL